MAMEVGMEDDVFFADLNRQISLLIDDDHDPLSHPQRVIFSPSTIYPPMLPSTQYMHQENYTREYSTSNKGTGVFIPQWPLLRRKYKEHRKRAKPNNSNKHFTKSKGRSPQT